MLVRWVVDVGVERWFGCCIFRLLYVSRQCRTFLPPYVWASPCLIASYLNRMLLSECNVSSSLSGKCLFLCLLKWQFKAGYAQFMYQELNHVIEGMMVTQGWLRVFVKCDFWFDWFDDGKESGESDSPFPWWADPDIWSGEYCWVVSEAAVAINQGSVQLACNPVF
jgi:hypothetical protein